MPDVTLPNGFVVNNVPEGMTQAELKKIALKNGLASEADFAAPAPEPEEEIGTLSNLVRGVGESALDTGADFIDFVEGSATDTLKFLDEKFGGDDGTTATLGSIFGDEPELPIGETTEAKFLRDTAEKMRGVDLGFEPTVTFEDVKEDPSLANIGKFSLEQGVTSTPQMAASVLALPAFVASQVENIARERAVNTGRTEDDVGMLDRAQAAPAAIVMSLLERFGTRGVLDTKDVGNVLDVGKEALKAGVKEGGTEAVQEPIQLAGEVVGTDKELTVDEILDRAAAGALGGGPFGSAVRGTTATAQLATGGDTGPRNERGVDDETLQAASDNIRSNADLSPEFNVADADIADAVIVDDTEATVDAEAGTETEVLEDTLDDAGVAEPVAEAAADALPAESQPDINAYGQAVKGADKANDIKAVNSMLDGENVEGTTQDSVRDTRPEITENDVNNVIPMSGYQGLITEKGLPPAPTEVILADGNKTRKHNPKKPTRYSEVKKIAKNIMGNRVFTGKVKKRGVEGFYRRSNAELRMRSHNEPEILAHEMAHFLDFHSKFNERFRNSYKGNEQVRQFSYTRDPKIVDSEGFAEFVRLWSTQYPVAKEMAPEYTKQFEKILRNDKALWNKMKKFQEAAHSFYAQGAELSGRAKIGETETMSDKVSDLFDADLIRQKTQDSVHAARVINRVLNGDIADKLEGSENLYNLFKIARGGSESIYKAILEQGTLRLGPDGDFFVSGKSLNDVLKPVTKQGAEVFDKMMHYFAMRRAAELTKQGRENLFKPEEIEAGLRFAKEHPEFEAVFEDYQRFNERMLDFYVDMGLMSEPQKAQFREMNEDYVPFHRVREVLLAQKNGRKGISQRLRGGTTNVRDIAENITDGLHSNIQSALEARAKRSMFNQIATKEDGALFAAPIDKDSEMVQVTEEGFALNMAKAMAELGLGISKDGMLVANANSDSITDISSIEAVLKENPDLLHMFSGLVSPRTDTTLVERVIDRDGNEQYFEVQEPLLIDMLQNLGGKSWGLGMRTMFGIKNLQTRTVTSMLQFLGGNAFRDTINAYEISKNGFVPLKDTLVGMYHYIKNDDVAQDAMRHGLGFSSRIHAGTEETRSRRQLDLPSRDFFDATAKALHKYEDIVSAFEYASRIGEFKKAKQAGKSSLQSAIEGRDISTDFSTIGSDDFVQGFIRTVPFMNAGLQGMVRTIQAMQSDVDLFRDARQNPEMLKDLEFYKASMAVKATPIIAGSLLLAAANSRHAEEEDDPRYNNLTDDQKARHWWIYYDKDEPPIKMPKNFDLGHMYGTIPEVMFDYVKNRDGEKMAEALAFIVTDMLSFIDAPGLVQSGLEDLKNEKFTGAPIVPKRLEALQGEDAFQQFTDRTPELYKKLGKALNVSPIKLEHYSKGFFRYLEAFAVDAAEMTLWDEEKFGERPFARDPLQHTMHHFRGRDVEPRTRQQETFYELYAKAQSKNTAFQKLAEESQVKGLDQALEDFVSEEKNIALKNLASKFVDLSKRLNGAQEQSLMIKYDKSLTAEEKENAINNIYRERNANFDSVVREIETELKKL